MRKRRPGHPQHLEDCLRFRRHYSAPAFKKKIKNLPRSTVTRTLEKALLLRELLLDRATPLWLRGAIIGALGYFILPADLVFDGIPGAGYVDDVAVFATILNQIEDLVTDEMKSRVRRRLSAGERKLTSG